MSAELLQEAAALMRQRAEGAARPLTEDWWEANAFKWLDRTSGVPSLAEHMSSWHPTVALAVAALLVDEAYWLSVDEDYKADRATAVARAYLGATL